MTVSGIWITAVLYAAVSFLLAVSGAVPLADRVIPLGADNYYFWQMIFSIPFVLFVWLGAGLVIRLAAGGKRGEAGIRAAVSASGPAAAVALGTALIPSAVEAVFMILGMEQAEFAGIMSEKGIWQTVYIGTYVLAACLALVSYYASSRKALKARPARALAAAILATAFTAGAFIVCIR